MPALAVTYAMPAPIIPAPTIPTLVGRLFATPFGRESPRCTACRSKKNAWIMFLDTWPGDQADEVPGLDGRRRVEVDLGALDGRGHDRPGSGHRLTVELAAQVRREGRQKLHERRGRRGAAGDREAGGIPRLHVTVRVRRDPGLGRGHQLVDGADQLVDHAHLEGLRWPHAVAVEQHRHERVLDAEQPHGAHHSPGTGQNPDPVAPKGWPKAMAPPLTL